MKKLIVFLFLIFLFSCAKVEDFCWECTCIKTDLVSKQVKYQKFEMCNKTEAEILDLCRTETYIVCYDSSVMKCEQK